MSIFFGMPSGEMVHTFSPKRLVAQSKTRRDRDNARFDRSLDLPDSPELPESPGSLGCIQPASSCGSCESLLLARFFTHIWEDQGSVLASCDLLFINASGKALGLPRLRKGGGTSGFTRDKLSDFLDPAAVVERDLCFASNRIFA